MREKDSVPFILLSGGNCERQTIKSSSQAFQHMWDLDVRGGRIYGSRHVEQGAGGWDTRYLQGAV